MTTRSLPALTLSSLLALAACSGNGADSSPPDTTAIEVAGSQSGAPGFEPLHEQTLTLSVREEGAASGTVGVAVGEEDLRIVVAAEGLAAERMHLVHIQIGRCGEAGGVVEPLGKLTPGPDGSGRVERTIALDALPASLDYLVQLYDPAGDPIACADVPTSVR